MGDAEEPAKKKKTPAQLLKLPRPVRWLREILAVLFWTAACVQLFVLDLGRLIAAEIPLLSDVVSYRGLIALVFVSLSWLVLGTRRFTLFFGYILFYPFVLLLWTLPKLMVRNWAVLIVFSPAIHSALTTFRFSFAMVSAAIISAVIIVASSSRMMVIAGLAVLAAYLISHYYSRFRIAFSPSTVFADVSGAIRAIWDAMEKAHWVKPPEQLERDSKEFKRRFGENLLALYMATTAFYIIGEKLSQVVQSRKLDVYFLTALLYTFALTVVIFAFEYFGIEKLYPGTFIGREPLRYFDFLGLSFSTLMTSELSPVRAHGIGLFAAYGELFCSLLIIVLLVFLVLTSIRERYRQDLDGVLKDIGSVSNRLGQFINDNYELSLTNAEAWLFRYNAPALKWCLRMRYGEEQAKKITETLEGATIEGAVNPPAEASSESEASTAPKATEKS